MGGYFRLAGRPLQKAWFSFKFLLKSAHFRSPVWGGTSGWPAGRFKKLGFLLNSRKLWRRVVVSLLNLFSLSHPPGRSQILPDRPRARSFSVPLSTIRPRNRYFFVPSSCFPPGNFAAERRSRSLLCCISVASELRCIDTGKNQTPFDVCCAASVPLL